MLATAGAETPSDRRECLLGIASVLRGLQETLAVYGKVGLAVHLCISTVSYTGCYTAVRWELLPVDAVLERLGAAAGSAVSDNGSSVSSSTAAASPGAGTPEAPVESREADGGRGGLLAAAGRSGGHAVVAYMLYKALFPVRAPITIALTPLVARLVHRMRPR